MPQPTQNVTTNGITFQNWDAVTLFDQNGNPIGTLASPMVVELATSAGSSAVTAADGALVTIGTTTDAPVTNPAAAKTAIGALGGLLSLLAGILQVKGTRLDGDAAAGTGHISVGGVDTGGLLRKILLDPLGAIYVRLRIGTTEISSSNPVPSTGVRYQVTPTNLADGAVQYALGDINSRPIVYLGTKIAGEDIANDILGTIPKVTNGQTYSRYERQYDGAGGRVVTSAASQLHGFYATNEKAVKVWLHVFNTASVAPTTGDTPTKKYPVPAGVAANPGMFILSDDLLGQNGIPFPLGMYVAISSTEATYTAVATTGDHELGIYTNV